MFIKNARNFKYDYLCPICGGDLMYLRELNL